MVFTAKADHFQQGFFLDDHGRSENDIAIRHVFFAELRYVHVRELDIEFFGRKHGRYRQQADGRETGSFKSERQAVLKAPVSSGYLRVDQERFLFQMVTLNRTLFQVQVRIRPNKCSHRFHESQRFPD
jgi:hypothetical protein